MIITMMGYGRARIWRREKFDERIALGGSDYENHGTELWGGLANIVLGSVFYYCVCVESVLYFQYFQYNRSDFG